MPLSPEQQNIAELPPAAQAVVIAGPGTGKTHVLVARLMHLIDRHDLLPGSEILVLSFSRAAVREIRTRLASADSDAKYVGAYTFDSYATRFLSEINPDGAWKQQDYDGRIRAATEKLNQTGGENTSFSKIRHVMIDEIQDLVTERADFVKAVLNSVLGGFTLYGDPAQGIYTWQVDGNVRAVGAAEFFSWLGIRFPNLAKFSLSRNYRAGTENAKIALWAGEKLNAAEPDYTRIHSGLKSNLLELKIRTLAMLAAQPQPLPKRTAILCRTNGQALVISRELHERHVPHYLQRLATERVLPAWLAHVLSPIRAQTITRTSFLDLAQVHLPDDLTPELAWQHLKRMDPSGNPKNLDLNTLNLYLRAGMIPDELIEYPKAQLVVSTIHRAKGLEFDKVYLAEHDPIVQNGDAFQFAEEVRVLYVAMTRAKQDQHVLESPDLNGIHKSARSDRWIKGFQNWQVLELEIVGDDAHRDDPAGTFLTPNTDPTATQEYLRSNVQIGDPLKLWQSQSFPDSPWLFSYLIYHDNRIVGVTSKGFGGTLLRTLQVYPGQNVKWPLSFTGLRVEGIDTVAGTPAAGQNAGLSPNGIWLRVRASGLGHAEYPHN